MMHKAFSPEHGLAAGGVEPGIYRHYKGHDYRVLGMAIHSETLEPMVVYQPLYGEGRIWVRPLSMFTETVSVDGEPVARFERTGD